MQQGEHAAHTRGPWLLRRGDGWQRVVAGLVAGALLLGLVLFVLGGHASGGPKPRPMPNVIGLPVDEARRALEQGGPVTIKVEPVPFGQAGVVQRVSGYEYDGTYDRDSVIVLKIGSR